MKRRWKMLFALFVLLLIGAGGTLLLTKGNDPITKDKIDLIMNCRTEQEVAVILGRSADLSLTPEEGYHSGPGVVKHWIGRKRVIEVWFQRDGECGLVSHWPTAPPSWLDSVQEWLTKW